MAGTFCYAHGFVDAWCTVCPPSGFPQVTEQEYQALLQREADQLAVAFDRQLDQVLDRTP